MAYSLATSYVGDAFLTGFNWFNGVDPSNGFVRYQSAADAEALDLYEIRPDGSVILGVDDTNVYPLGTGRPSVRLESKVAYDSGLFIGDFAHMPPSTCGLWPAFWMYGPDWPNNGEIDIIEGANRATRNLISAHTSEGCTIPRSGIETSGTAVTFDCTSPGNNNNAGCSFVPPDLDTATYGDTFNAAGGGVYAVEWTSEDIRIWHWPRSRIPQDITSKQPNPASWGPPTALFGTETCEPDRYFRQMSIVIQTNFCGDYAGATWGGECSAAAPTCEQYVANNPSVFSNAFWEVNYIDVYQRSADTPTDEPTTTTTVEITSTVTVTVQPQPPTSSPSLTTSGQGSTTLSLPSGSSSAQTSSSQATSTQTLSSQSSSASASSVSSGATSSSSAQTSPTLSQSTQPASSSTGSQTITSPSTSQPTPSNTPPPPGDDSLNIGEYAFLGCFASENGFTTFEFAAAGPNMTPDLCVETCAGRPYAGIHNDQCLCATALDPQSRALADMSQCDIPCPGDPDEFCGGFLSQSVGGFSVAPLRLLQRQDNREVRPASDYLVSLYGVVGGRGEIPEPAPPLGEGSTWQGGNGQGGLPSGWSIITVPYVTVLPTDPARLITTEYCITVGPCDDGCNRPPTPSMTTIIEVCEECGPGGESDVTLTVPEDVVGPTARPSPPPPAPSPPPPPPPPPAPSGNRQPPIESAPADVRPPAVSSTPTGAVQSESGAVLSVGVAILLPLAVTVMRLLL